MIKHFIRNRTSWLKILVIFLTILVCLSYFLKAIIKDRFNFELPDSALFQSLVGILGLLFVLNQENFSKISLEEKRPELQYKIYDTDLVIINTGLFSAINMSAYSYSKNENGLGIFNNMTADNELSIANNCDVILDINEVNTVIIVYQNALTKKPYINIFSIKNKVVSYCVHFELNLLQKFVSKFSYPDSYPKNISRTVKTYITKWIFEDLKKNIK